MLPRSDGVRIAEPHRQTRSQGSHAIRNEPVSRPVAAADDVTRARRRDGRPISEEAVPKAAGDQFGTRFTVAVRVVTAQAIILGEGAASPEVLIHFVAGDDDDTTQIAHATARLEHAGRA